MRKIMVSGCLLIGLSGLAIARSVQMGTTTISKGYAGTYIYETLKDEDGRCATTAQLAGSFEQIKPKNEN